MIEKPKKYKLRPENSFDEILVFPIIRRVVARTIALDLVTVTPMEPPLNIELNEIWPNHANPDYFGPLSEMKKCFLPKPVTFKRWYKEKNDPGIGMIFAPYIPMMVTSPLVNEDFLRANIISSRYSLAGN